MDIRLLIDQIVRQTTVLLAQLSTAAGVRAPIAHIADQVFLELATEIERQGVGRKVAADMFGMALRTYQRRVQRVSESVSVRDRTLWEAVLDYLGAEGSRSRKEILHRFRWDGDANVAAVLNDLTNSGLVYRVGRGERAVYGITPDADLERLIEYDARDALTALIWVQVYRMGAASTAELTELLRIEEERVQEAIDGLVQDGRLSVRASDDRYTTHEFRIPVGATSGWEAAVYDHFQAMAKAIAHKLQSVGGRSEFGDRIGGATLSFDLDEDHPLKDEVFGLLERVRADVNDVWNRVVEHAEQHPIDPATHVKVTFYFGQNVEALGDEEGRAEADPADGASHEPSPDDAP